MKNLDPSKDRDGRTPLHMAAFGNDVARAKELLVAGSDPNAGDKEGLTPLHLAAQQYALEVAALLLRHGASVDVQNSYGNTPLHTAVFNSCGGGRMVELLRADGADAAKAHNFGTTQSGSPGSSRTTTCANSSPISPTRRRRLWLCCPQLCRRSYSLKGRA